MNKRIKELMIESIDHACANQQSMDTAMEKLAELIIQECSAVANHFSDGHELDQFGRKMYHYTADIGQAIDRYFGVK